MHITIFRSSVHVFTNDFEIKTMRYYKDGQIYITANITKC